MVGDGRVEEGRGGVVDGGKGKRGEGGSGTGLRIDLQALKYSDTNHFPNLKWIPIQPIKRKGREGVPLFLEREYPLKLASSFLFYSKKKIEKCPM